METQWCKCKIVQPMIMQKNNTLICCNCQSKKELPPKIDLKWEKVKKELAKEGRTFYAEYHKDLLIDMLVKRDMQMLDDWNYHRPYDFLDKATLRKRIESLVEYVKFQKPESKEN